ncbi:MAG: hypothetical protein EG826_15230 [Deltaproteobacteria bacterium]|nr:hypothetical protein [Deltaproteobacteria bacterium]
MGMKVNITNIFLFATAVAFFVSCSFFTEQTKKTEKEQTKKTEMKESPKAPAASEDVKPRSKAGVKESPPKASAVKESPSKAPAAVEKHRDREQTPPHKESASHPPAGGNIPATQQKYYNMGMRYYAQDKFEQAKEAWQAVIKLDRKTDLAEKARENIKKVDQILKRLKEMSGS